MDDRTVTTMSAGGADTRRTDPPHCTVVMWRSTVWDSREAQGASECSGRPLVRCPRTARERLRDNVVITLVAAPLTKLSSSFGGGRRLFRLLGRRWE